MRIDVVTIFPDFLSPLRLSLLGRAQGAGLVDLRVHDLRTWTHDRHRTVDDTPYGGGPGMVMRPEPWGEVIDWLLSDGGAPPTGGDPVGTDPDAAVPSLVVPTPSGRRMEQATAARLAQRPWLVFACGRYEGIDQRVIDWAARRIPVEEISLGDFVLNGGEVAAMAIIESVARLLPGFLGNSSSLDEESYADGLLEYPVYTKPPTWRGLEVPSVLLSGHHGRIAAWRRAEAERRTRERRPDLVPPASDTADPRGPDG
jgi:tRNA (guanine37-N1)-methyltransferase